jgi:methylated-DNA-[protein]-cysteine S-methyltransferase
MRYAPILTNIATAIGTVHIWGDEAALWGVRIDSEAGLAKTDPLSGAVAQAAEELERYFAGALISFTTRCAPSRSPRGQELRAAIVAVPYGETATYSEVARHISSGPRAIGTACRTNPFPIIVPCHRIVSAHTDQSYYSGGGGPKTKAWLNAHERRYKGA